MDDFGNDLLKDSHVDDLMQELTIKLISEVEQKRRKVISERLKTLTGIEFDFDVESKRRFKRFAIEYKGSEEIIYYNDGSEKGLRVVTFIKDDQTLTFESDRNEMRVGYSYY